MFELINKIFTDKSANDTICRKCGKDLEPSYVDRYITHTHDPDLDCQCCYFLAKHVKNGICLKCSQ